MEKSAIALRMTNGTGQFIKDYMFPRSKEDTIAAISDQLASYREIKEQVESLEKEIAMLEEIQRHDQALTKAQADQIFTEARAFFFTALLNQILNLAASKWNPSL